MFITWKKDISMFVYGSYCISNLKYFHVQSPILSVLFIHYLVKDFYNSIFSEETDVYLIFLSYIFIYCSIHMDIHVTLFYWHKSCFITYLKTCTILTSHVQLKHFIMHYVTRFNTNLWTTIFIGMCSWFLFLMIHRVPVLYF